MAEPSKPRRRLRRTGFAVAGVAAILLVLTAIVFIQQWREDMDLREASRTLEGPVRGGDIVHDHAARLFAMLPPRASLGDDGFRFVAVPELSYYSYALSLSAKGAIVEGALVATERSRDGKKGTTTRQSFTMPRNDYGPLIVEMDHLADGYAGNNLQCMDGTVIAFERIRGTRVTSGLGNACAKHYAAIGEIVRLTLMRFVTPPGSPLGHDWYPGF